MGVNFPWINTECRVIRFEVEDKMAVSVSVLAMLWEIDLVPELNSSILLGTAAPSKQRNAEDNNRDKLEGCIRKRKPSKISTLTTTNISTTKEG